MLQEGYLCVTKVFLGHQKVVTRVFEWSDMSKFHKNEVFVTNNVTILEGGFLELMQSLNPLGTRVERRTFPILLRDTWNPVSDGNITWLMVRGIVTNVQHVTRPGFYISRICSSVVTIVSVNG